MDCALSIVLTEGFALDVPLDTPAGERRLPRGSLVRAADLPCDGVAVEVVSTAGWYRVPSPAIPGDRGCVAPGALAPTAGLRFIALADTTSAPAGALLDAPASCDADLAALRAIDAPTLRSVEAVRDTYVRLSGPLGLHQVPWTDWGYVGLPLPLVYTDARLAEEHARERLVTPAQRERAVAAEGPGYAHFWGADAPFSDIWARPETIAALLRVAAGWAAACGDPACLLQVGDLAWYNPVKPDPLGHKDHFDGRCGDVRLFRTDGARYEAWWDRPDDRTGVSAYDPVRTGDFLAWVAANERVEEAFFNDPAVRARLAWVKPMAGHDDHVHLCFAE